MSGYMANRYRAFVVSFVDALLPDEINKIANFYGTRDVDVESFSLAGLGLFASLERSRIFSQSRVEGLIQVAKVIKREDLAKRVEAFIERVKEDSSYGTNRKPEKERASLSKEPLLLKQAFETTSTDSSHLEQLQPTLQCRDGNAVEARRKIVHYFSDVAEVLASNLSKLDTELVQTQEHDVKCEGRANTLTEDDVTGDSGVGTGSQYGDVYEWKRAMQCPPPVKYDSHLEYEKIQQARYTPLIKPTALDTASSPIMPEFFSRITTLIKCSRDGKVNFYDPFNEFGLEIPEGAIPEGENINIDIGVGMCGPFQFPKGLKPVSPVFWVCVRESKFSHFLKPVTVTIPHCIDIKTSDCLGLTFHKGKHTVNSQGMYTFQEVERSEMIFKERRGLLKTTHFCCLCITGKVSPELTKSTKFCMCAVTPFAVVPMQPTYCRFFISFLLATCMKTVEKQIASSQELQNHKLSHDHFKFCCEEEDPTLEIVLPHAAPDQWNIGLQYKTKIFLSDIEFVTDGEDVLKLLEDKGMYPPRFNVVISCSPMAKQGQERILFKGTTSGLVYDIPLNLQHENTQGAAAANVALPSPLDHESSEFPLALDLHSFLNHVGAKIPSKWRLFGIALQIPLCELDTFPSDNCLECFIRVFDTWNRINSPEVSWKTVIGILQLPTLKENKLAERVKMRVYGSPSLPPKPTRVKQESNTDPLPEEDYDEIYAYAYVESPKMAMPPKTGTLPKTQAFMGCLNEKGRNNAQPLPARVKEPLPSHGQAKLELQVPLPKQYEYTDSRNASLQQAIDMPQRVNNSSKEHTPVFIRIDRDTTKESALDNIIHSAVWEERPPAVPPRNTKPKGQVYLTTREKTALPTTPNSYSKSSMGISSCPNYLSVELSSCASNSNVLYSTCSLPSHSHKDVVPNKVMLDFKHASKSQPEQTGEEAMPMYSSTYSTTMAGNKEDICLSTCDTATTSNDTFHQTVEITNDNITELKELGTGEYGKIVLALTKKLSLKDMCINDWNEDRETSLYVTVKKLQTNPTSAQRKAFEREGELVSCLSHPNVVMFLGVCYQEPAFFIMEYMENGDLSHFLPQYSKIVPTPSYDCHVATLIVVRMATQIASGMRYLTSQKIVHRDLASRNCLVGRKFLVKLGNFGMSRKLSESHCYHIQDIVALPIRWLPTESFNGIFSEKTDVWAFGITVWELFTLAKEKPYPDLTDLQVVEDAINRGAHRKLHPKPDACPQKVYDSIMLRCWAENPKERPTFKILHELLQGLENL